VAVPRGLPRREVLDLASLVLTRHEYREFQHRMPSAAGPGSTGVTPPPA
jgi:hypothetical protein